jgi:hypothetical protein
MRSRHAKPSDRLHRGDFRCLMCSKKVRPSLKARKVVGRERRAQNWGQPRTARLLSPKTLWTRRWPSECRLAGLFASGPSLPKLRSSPLFLIFFAKIHPDRKRIEIHRSRTVREPILTAPTLRRKKPDCFRSRKDDCIDRE